MNATHTHTHNQDQNASKYAIYLLVCVRHLNDHQQKEREKRGRGREGELASVTHTLGQPSLSLSQANLNWYSPLVVRYRTHGSAWYLFLFQNK